MPAQGHTRTALRLTPVLVLTALLAACGKGQPDGGHGGMPPAMVTYQVVKAGDVPVDFEYPGQSAGSREVEIRARVTGIVDKRLYEEGARVKAGTSLFRIDPATYAAAAAAADANVTTAEARLKQAERDYNRVKPLIESKAISQQEFDNAASNFDIAKAALKAAQAQARATSIDLGYTDVRAPISGVVGRALKVEGSLANAQGDSLLATMAQTDPIDVNFALSESDRTRVQAEVASGAIKLPEGGYTVKLKTSDGNWLKHTGKLDFSDYKADTTTGTYSSRARFANPDNTLTPGQFVRVVLSGATRPNSIAVPQRAVLDGPQGKFVYTVGAGQDGKPAAVPMPVVVGDWVRLDGKEPNGWLIKQGLKGGEKVIVDGTARIFFPFAPIVPMTPEEAAKAAQQPPGGAPAAKH
ncbi:efflux RND transporter periplasmic adaptor subunit [Chitinimonas sp. BJYL2]|uniref:efflux RND transporter periplasmic adaptor subunit n=1 Tax=Chitinimonas sp. BJYL2 TaxID=2976696 RepID=UPI0022B55958|nr:efflux RND transporter periplasmic adaptor subunit [Chitinimonas sp. BJYL2]